LKPLPGRSGLAWTGALLFAILSAALFAAHLNELALIARVAERADAGRQLSGEQRLALYVRFARDGLYDPQSLAEVRPWPIRAYYRLNPLHPGAGDVLQWGSDYRGSCGSHSRVVAAMLRARGIPSRLRLLLDDRGQSAHTVVEARVDGRWIVGDAEYGIAFHRWDGIPATVADVAADRALFHAHVDTVPGYNPEFGYDSTTLLNWRKIPVILPAIHDGLVWLLGPERVAGITRPNIWMWPRAFYALVCLILSAACALAAVRLGRAAGSPAA
jgi:hypothetical protein